MKAYKTILSLAAVLLTVATAQAGPGGRTVQLPSPPSPLPAAPAPRTQIQVGGGGNGYASNGEATVSRQIGTRATVFTSGDVTVRNRNGRVLDRNLSVGFQFQFR